MATHFKQLAIDDEQDLVFGTAKFPLSTKKGMTIGGGHVYPELNFTFPPIQICDANFDKIREMYKIIIIDACQRAVEL